MKKIWIMILGGLLAFTVVAQNAQAQSAGKDRVVISPFWQAEPGAAVYTFIGITHPSLDTANSQIGFTLTAVGGTGATGSSNPSTTFTITSGQTHRVFIAATNSAISAANLDPDGTNSRLHFITTTSGSSSFGLLRATSSNVTPAIPVSTNPMRFNNLSQLNFWGAIVILSTTSGFAMEFIGDAHDSSILPNTSLNAVDGTTTGPARGIN